MKHSPAPWETSRDAVPAGHVQVTVYDKDSNRVATVFQNESNVALIAAAPVLLNEAITLHSRIRAILNCDEALDALCAYDVFGAQYAELLAEDEQKLREAIISAGGETEGN